MTQRLTGIRIYEVGASTVDLCLDYASGRGVRTYNMSKYDMSDGVPSKLLSTVIGAIRELCIPEPKPATLAALPPYPNW